MEPSSPADATIPVPMAEVKVDDASESKVRPHEGWHKVRSVARIFHLFSVAFIVGQTFSVFIYGSQFDLRDNYASFILEMVFIVILVISGLLNMWSIMRIF